ncbi:integrase, catalytic region, zinc finger, CCHC-type containing protein [Tanacetum coccineum]
MEDMAYPCPKLHSTSTKRRSISPIQMKPYAIFKKNTSIRARDAGFGRGTQANEDAQGYLRVTHDVVMLRVLHITLTGAAKSHQKVNIFNNGLGTMNRQLIDLQGPIPGMTPAQALTTIQTMADHSQKLHDGSSSKNINSSRFQTCGGTHLDKECPLNEELKSMEEVKYGEFGRPFPNNSQNDRRFNREVSGYGSHNQPSSRERRPSPTRIINSYMEEETKRHAEQDEWLRIFYQNSETNRENHDKIIQGLETKVKTLTNEVEGRTNGGKVKECKAIFTNDGSPLYTPFYYSPEEIRYFSANSGMGKLELVNMVIEMADNIKCTPKGIVKNLLIKINKFIFPVDFFVLDIVEDFRMPIILGKPLLATTHAKVSYEEVVYMMTDQGDLWKNEEIDEANMEQNLDLTPIRKPKMTRERILKDPWRERFKDEDDDTKENLEDPVEYGEDKANAIIGVVHDKLNDDWFNGTSEDEDDLEGIIDYLEPKSYNGFINLDDEAYNEREVVLERERLDEHFRERK